MRRKVCPVWRSAARISSSASQQISTWADVVLEAVKDGAQLEGVLQIAERALGVGLLAGAGMLQTLTL